MDEIKDSAGNEIVSIARGAGIVLFGTAAGFVFRYGFQVLAARGLGPEMFGIFFLGLSVYKVMEMVAQLGLPNGVVRYVSIHRGQNDDARIKGTIFSALKIVGISSLAAAGLVVLGARPLAAGVFHHPETAGVLIAFAGLLPFASATAIFIHAAQGFGLMKFRVIVTEIIEPLGRILLVSGLFIFGFRLEGVVAAYAVPTIAGTALAGYLMKKAFSPLLRRDIRPVSETSRLLSFSWPLLFVQFIGLLLLWTDTLMLGYLRTAGEVGVYSAVQRTAVTGTIVLTAFNTVFAPLISRLHDQGRTLELKSLFQTVAKWTFTFSLPIYLAMILLRKPLLALFGPEFVSGSAALAVLSLGWIVHSGTGSTGVMLSMTGRPMINLLNMSGFFVLNIILNLILIPKYGILGAASATAFSLTAGNAASVVITRAFFKVLPFRKDFLKPVGACLAALGLFFLVRNVVFPTAGLPGAVFGGLAFIASYFVVLRLSGIHPEDQAVLERLRKSFFERKSMPLERN